MKYETAARMAAQYLDYLTDLVADALYRFPTDVQDELFEEMRRAISERMREGHGQADAERSSRNQDDAA